MGKLLIDLPARTAEREGAAVHLTQIEYRLTFDLVA